MGRIISTIDPPLHSENKYDLLIDELGPINGEYYNIL